MNNTSKRSLLDLKLITLNILSFLLNTSSSLLAPYYPTIASKYYLSNYLIGLVLASHAIGCFFFSLILTKTLSSWGRRNLMGIGVFFHITGNVLFGSLGYFSGYSSFLSVSLISRFIQGLGFAAFTTASLALIPHIYQNQEEKIEGYLEVSSSLGAMMGPLVGSFLYLLGGYQTPFYCLAGLEFLFLLALLKLFSNDIAIKLKNKGLKSVSIKKVFLSREGVFGFLAVVVAVSSYNFMDPSLSYRLDLYQVSATLFGVFFTLTTFAYIISMLIIERFSSTVDKRVWMSLGIFITGLTYYFLLFQELWGLSYGLVTLGFGTALILIPSLQQYRIMAFKTYRDEKDRESVNDMTSGIFGSAYAVGELLGPVVGGVLIDQFGFIKAVKWYGIGMFGFFMLYLYVGDSLYGFLSVMMDLEEGKEGIGKKNEPVLGKRVNFSARRFTVLKEEVNS